MARRNDKNLLVGLDIGTSKIACLVGELKDDDQIEIIGIGTSPSRGLKKGVVVDIESTVTSIQRAVEAAEAMAGCDIHSVHAGIAGNHISSRPSNGSTPIKEREVNQADVDRVLDNARAVAIPADQQMLHLVPQEYIIDGQEGIRQPIGMCGVRLEARVLIVTGAVSAAQNIRKCIGRCGLEVDYLMPAPLSASYSVLGEDEQELGVCLVDIGGGTTDIAVFADGAIRHTAVIPIAGDQVTNDIALALRTPTQHAEQIKIQHACALTQLAGGADNIEVPSIGDRPLRRLSRQTLAEVVGPRYEELLDLVRKDLDRSGFKELVAGGVVLTGGSAKMQGLIELAEEVFHMPVRLGVPRYVIGMDEVMRDPVYATGVGLLIYAGQNRFAKRPELTAGRGFKGLVSRTRSWFQGNF